MGRAERRRGRDLEFRVARELGGVVWPHQDGDVEARGFRFECKFRRGWRLQSTREFLEWLEQVERYRERNPGTAFALVFWGGGRRFEPLVCLPLSAFERLTRPVDTEGIRAILGRIRGDLLALLAAAEGDHPVTDVEEDGGETGEPA